MPILPIPTPTSSFQIGLRAVIRTSERYLQFVAAPTARKFSTSLPSPSLPCFQHNRWGVARLPTTLYTHRSRTILSQIHVRTIFNFRAITRYIDLPDWYEDAEGLPFRREDLNQTETNRIFPSNLAAPRANQLLKIIHGRRVAGTLDDPILAQNTKQFRIADQKRALEYLREHVPVDEVLNAGLRAEDELKAIEEGEIVAQEAEEQFEKKRTQAPPSNIQEKVKVPTGRLPKKPRSDSPYGESNFDRIRAENIAKREAEEKRLEEERKQQEEEMAKGNIGTLQTQQEKPRELSAFRKKHIERATSDLEAPPEMKPWERLLPTITMAALIVMGSLGFAALYLPPPPSRRLWPDIPPAAATCLGLIGLNLTVWMLWMFPPAWAVLNRYMVLIAATPRPLQLLGAMFSHQKLGHLAVNMTMLWFFGTRVHDEIGRGNFLALYFASGAVGFAASLTNLVLRRGLEFTTLGASGAVYGVIIAFFWMHKFDEFKIFGYPPDPISGPQGLGFIGLILGIHLVPLFSKRIHNVDIASHIGGMFTGALGIDLARRHMNHKVRIRAERMKSMGLPDQVAQTQVKPLAAAEAQSSSPPKR
ncbi:rhomboid-domain-containing protein [Xylariaceae sp. FL1651]|nr:rhomboid-domain-containing protein [Xylariaceae sp. FL1651]